MMITKEAAQDLRQSTIDHFWETIPPLWNEVRSHLRTIAAEEFGISVEQFHILRHIRKGITSVSELAEFRQISRPAASQAIDVLFEKGLLTRRQSSQDRRYVELGLTEEGSALLNAIFTNNRAWMMEKLADLPDAEISGLIHAMQLLKSTFLSPD